MNINGQIYGNIEKEINANQNKWLDYLKDFFWRIFYLLNKREFQFKGQLYRYFYHPYNKTWRNERAVEIPICKGLLSDYNKKNILEVGNVLSHYFPCSHTVVDKYEKGSGLINTDISEYHTDKKFDLIISISTLEHVGWDEIPKDPSKILKSVEQMKKMLAPDGRIFITIPLGYNPDLQTAYLKRFSP
jgi:SAM-dependent methyltransferase